MASKNRSKHVKSSQASTQAHRSRWHASTTEGTQTELDKRRLDKNHNISPVCIDEF